MRRTNVVAIAAAILFAACALPPDDDAVAIERFTGAVSGRWEFTDGMNYDPSDIPVAWPSDSTLIVMHDEHDLSRRARSIAGRKHDRVPRYVHESR